MNGVEVRPQVSDTTDSNEHKLSGTARLFAAFVVGAVFALAAMYYFLMGRQASLNKHASFFTFHAFGVHFSGLTLNT